jgi:hypothetical protein
MTAQQPTTVISPTIPPPIHPSVQQHRTQYLHRTKPLKTSINNLDTKVEENQQNTNLELNEYNESHKQQIAQVESDNNLALKNLSSSFIEQIDNNQTTNNNLLEAMLQKRDDALNTKMNEHLELILGKLTQDSPTRKKQAQTNNIHINDTSVTQTSSDHNSTVSSTQHQTNHLENPYHTNTIRRRSAQNVLPTMSS